MVFDQVLEELDQKGSVGIAKYNIFKKILGRFFHGSGFLRLGSGFLTDPDKDSGKKVSSGSGQKDPDPKHFFKGKESTKSSRRHQLG